MIWNGRDEKGRKRKGMEIKVAEEKKEEAQGKTQKRGKQRGVKAEDEEEEEGKTRKSQ